MNQNNNNNNNNNDNNNNNRKGQYNNGPPKQNHNNWGRVKGTHEGTVRKWMIDRGMGYIQCDDFPRDIQARLDSIGGGNLVVGRKVKFEVYSGPGIQPSRAMNVTGPGVNKVWIDTEGNHVNWEQVGLRRELRRVQFIEDTPPSQRTAITFLETSYLTDPESDDKAFAKMFEGKEALEQRLRANLPPGMRLDPVTLEAVPDDRPVKLQRDNEKKIARLGLVLPPVRKREVFHHQHHHQHHQQQWNQQQWHQQPQPQLQKVANLHKKEDTESRRMSRSRSRSRGRDRSEVTHSRDRQPVSSGGDRPRW